MARSSPLVAGWPVAQALERLVDLALGWERDCCTVSYDCAPIRFQLEKVGQFIGRDSLPRRRAPLLTKADLHVLHERFSALEYCSACARDLRFLRASGGELRFGALHPFDCLRKQLDKAAMLLSAAATPRCLMRVTSRPLARAALPGREVG